MARKNKRKKGKGLKRREMQQLLTAQLNLPQNRNRGMFGSLGGLLPKGRTEQLLLGLVVGGAAAYVLSDDELRGKLFKGAMKAYASIMGSVAEMKEQLADVAAEVEAEQSAAA